MLKRLVRIGAAVLALILFENGLVGIPVSVSDQAHWLGENGGHWGIRVAALFVALLFALVALGPERLQRWREVLRKPPSEPKKRRVRLPAMPRQRPTPIAPPKMTREELKQAAKLTAIQQRIQQPSNTEESTKPHSRLRLAVVDVGVDEYGFRLGGSDGNFARNQVAALSVHNASEIGGSSATIRQVLPEIEIFDVGGKRVFRYKGWDFPGRREFTPSQEEHRLFIAEKLRYDAECYGVRGKPGDGVYVGEDQLLGRDDTFAVRVTFRGDGLDSPQVEQFTLRNKGRDGIEFEGAHNDQVPELPLGADLGNPHVLVPKPGSGEPDQLILIGGVRLTNRSARDQVSLDFTFVADTPGGKGSRLQLEGLRKTPGEVLRPPLKITPQHTEVGQLAFRLPEIFAAMLGDNFERLLRRGKGGANARVEIRGLRERADRHGRCSRELSVNQLRPFVPP
jgi:hypothetical protein